MNGVTDSFYMNKEEESINLIMGKDLRKKSAIFYQTETDLKIKVFRVDKLAIQKVKSKIRKIRRKKFKENVDKYVNDLEVRIKQFNSFKKKYPLSYRNSKINVRDSLFDVCLHQKARSYRTKTDISSFKVDANSLKEGKLMMDKTSAIKLYKIKNIAESLVKLKNTNLELFRAKFEGIVKFHVFSEIVVALNKFYSLVTLQKRYHDALRKNSNLIEIQDRLIGVT